MKIGERGDNENLGVHTIYALESTARWDIDIVAVGTEQFDGIDSRYIRPSARDNIGSHTVYPWARAKYSGFVFVHLDRVVSI